LHGFAVDVKADASMPVVATVFIDAGRFEDVKKRQGEVEQSIRGRLAGLTKKDLSPAATSTAIQLDIRSALNSAMPGHPIRYVSLKLDVK
jgi:hypothetical protein